MNLTTAITGTEGRNCNSKVDTVCRLSNVHLKGINILE